MSIFRQAVYDEGDFGMWSVACADCPLKPHTDALGQRPPQCAGGMATNMQGPVVLKRCDHMGRQGDGGLKREGEQLLVDCMKDAAA